MNKSLKFCLRYKIRTTSEQSCHTKHMLQIEGGKKRGGEITGIEWGTSSLEKELLLPPKLFGWVERKRQSEGMTWIICNYALFYQKLDQWELFDVSSKRRGIFPPPFHPKSVVGPLKSSPSPSLSIFYPPGNLPKDYVSLLSHLLQYIPSHPTYRINLQQISCSSLTGVWNQDIENKKVWGIFS